MRLAAAAFFWCTAALALGVGALIHCPARDCPALKADQALLHMMHAWQQPWLTTFFAAATWLGSMYVLLPVTVGLAWHFRQTGRGRAALLLPLTLAGAWLLAHLAKLLVGRPRPDLYPPLITMPNDPSFPSAHTLQIAAFACALAVAPGVRRHRGIMAAAALAVCVVALSRVYLQVHFPSDVLFALIAAAGWVCGLRLLLAARP